MAPWTHGLPLSMKETLNGLLSRRIISTPVHLPCDGSLRQWLGKPFNSSTGRIVYFSRTCLPRPKRLVTRNIKARDAQPATTSRICKPRQKRRGNRLFARQTQLLSTPNAFGRCDRGRFANSITLRGVDPLCERLRGRCIRGASYIATALTNIGVVLAGHAFRTVVNPSGVGPN